MRKTYLGIKTAVVHCEFSHKVTSLIVFGSLKLFYAKKNRLLYYTESAKLPFIFNAFSVPCVKEQTVIDQLINNFLLPSPQPGIEPYSRNQIS